MISKPIRFITFVIVTAVLSSCVLFEDELAAPALEHVGALGEALEACRADAVVTEGIIWLNAAVKADEVVGLDQFIAESPFVKSYRYIDEQETYEDFQEYFADEPEILDLVTPANLPTSFEVVFDDQADTAAVVAEIESLAVVDIVELDPDRTVCLAEATALREACNQPPTDLEITLRQNVDETTLVSVSAALEQSPIVAGFRYVDLEETVAEYEEYWANDPDVLELLDPEKLPTSFTAATTDEFLASENWEQQIDDLAVELQQIDGVDATDREPTEVTEACWHAVSGGVVSQLLEKAE